MTLNFELLLLARERQLGLLLRSRSKLTRADFIEIYLFLNARVLFLFCLAIGSRVSSSHGKRGQIYFPA